MKSVYIGLAAMWIGFSVVFFQYAYRLHREVSVLKERLALAEKLAEGNASLLHMVTRTTIGMIELDLRRGEYAGENAPKVPELYRTVMRLDEDGKKVWLGYRSNATVPNK